MRVNKTIAILVVLFGLLIGGLGAGIWLSQQPLSANAAPPVQEDTTCVDDEDDQQEAEDEADEAEDCNDDVNESSEVEDDDDASETDEAEDDDNDEAGDVDEPGDVEEDDDDAEQEDENEAGVSPDQTSITADEAKAAAEAAYPGAKALEVELENEHGTVAYEVELDNGLEVMVDSADGSILGTDTD